ncbi:hypothetical protein PHJA_000800500 [Phtheirospermum japonicum]|uniref:F-box/LRR-repeat protein 15/At3g58940/PEG3-like LRR domain-containing protein n=1 Tax=Phtheirospermum japonicum TaxID=374723 RepID=A0A830BGV2_9LAMI|nr:hypothetical protein PHJA_000800500 [Phtheirospermum japonicum]
MGKRRQIEAINGEFQLPEPVIQRIQSFLTAREAARTTTLSKSWYSAWLTRPNLDLDETNFNGYRGDSKFDEFSEFAKKTIKRYEQSNLNIESFRLQIKNPWGNLAINASGDLANDLITRALRIGATHLSFQQVGPYESVVLSPELFEAENLVGISVGWCIIDDLGLDREVRCSKLKSLSLSSVEITSEMISNITSCCPLIEKLSLSSISSFKRKKKRKGW